MRRVVASACVGLTALCASCSDIDRTYFRYGVGTDLEWEGMPEATRLQELYLGHLCQQAGLAVTPSGEAVPYCSDRGLGARSWLLVVQAGMNDIDRRCDAYLAWLDNRRRWTGPIRQQINDTRTAVEAILTATTVGPKTIGIVGAAFGLAYQTFTNINSRLLLEVEQSTVQSVVLSRQQKYREGLPKVIDNKAAAVYALRSYLRLCMPFTIETEINTTVRLFELGGAPAMRAAELRPLINPNTVRSALIRDPSAPLPPPPRPRPVTDDVRIGPFEPQLTPAQIRAFQKVVCIAETGKLGDRGSDTRKAIKAYLVKIKEKTEADDDTISDRDGIVLRRAVRAGRRDC
jgi:hypothetical protein